MNGYSPEEDAIILDHVEKAQRAGTPLTEGLKEAAQKLNRTYYSVKLRYYNNLRTIKNTPQKEIKSSEVRPFIPSVHEALARMVLAGEIPPATKEKLNKVAGATGKHYHTVLSVWGNMVKSGETEHLSVSTGESAVEPFACNDRNCPWYKSKIIFCLRESGLGFAQIATQLGISDTEARDMYKTFKTFPGYHGLLPFSYYLMIARKKTDNPKEWVQKALFNRWTKNDLENALAGRDVQSFKDRLNKQEATNAELRAHGKKLHAKAVALLKKNHRQKREFAQVLGVIAAELGVTLSGKREITANAANEIVGRLLTILEENRAIRKINVQLLNMLSRRNRRPGGSQQKAAAR